MFRFFLPKTKPKPRRFLGLDAPLRFFRKDAIYEAGKNGQQWSSTPRSWLSQTQNGEKMGKCCWYIYIWFRYTISWRLDLLYLVEAQCTKNCMVCFFVEKKTVNIQYIHLTWLALLVYFDLVILWCQNHMAAMEKIILNRFACRCKHTERHLPGMCNICKKKKSIACQSGQVKLMSADQCPT